MSLRPRIQLAIWRVAEDALSPNHWHHIINTIALKIGRSDVVPNDDYSRVSNKQKLFRSHIGRLLSKGFLDALRAAEAVRQLFQFPNLFGVNASAAQDLFDSLIAEISSVNGDILNVRWENGRFWPAGAAELDDALVRMPMDWLRRHNLDSVTNPFEKSLRHLLNGSDEPERYQDAITDSYEALESLSKIVTGKPNTDLSRSRQEFGAMVSLHENFVLILKEYIRYGCKFRHGHGQEGARSIPTRADAEYFVYITGAFIRHAIENRDGWSQTQAH